MSIKKHDIPFAGEIVFEYVTRDKEDFQNYSEDFSDIKLAEILAKIEASKLIIYPRNYTNSMNALKETEHQNMINCRPMINKCEERAIAAAKIAPLTVGVGEFGFHEIREAIDKGGIGLFNSTFASIKKNIDDNISVLNDRGFSDDNYLVLKGFKAAAVQAQTDAQAKQTQRDNAVTDIKDELKEITDFSATACNVGQNIYKSPKVEEKLIEYAMTNVAIRLHPTPETAPVNKYLNHNSQRAIYIKLEKGERIRVTLKTRLTTATICRQEDPAHITPCIGGTPLVYNVPQTFLEADIPGTGTAVIITNPTDKLIEIEILRIKA